eukprot:2104038-Karenia_brevis.AAC.1
MLSCPGAWGPAPDLMTLKPGPCPPWQITTATAPPWVPVFGIYGPTGASMGWGFKPLNPSG